MRPYIYINTKPNIHCVKMFHHVITQVSAFCRDIGLYFNDTIYHYINPHRLINTYNRIIGTPVHHMYLKNNQTSYKAPQARTIIQHTSGLMI